MRLGWRGRTGDGQLKLASGFRPIVVVDGRNRTQQEMRVGFEGVQLQSSAGFPANQGCDLPYGSARVGGRKEIVETQQRVRSRIFRIERNGLVASTPWRGRVPPADRLSSDAAL
jgi:hypothetical protein